MDYILIIRHDVLRWTNPGLSPTRAVGSILVRCMPEDGAECVSEGLIYEVQFENNPGVCVSCNVLPTVSPVTPLMPILVLLIAGADYDVH